VSIENVRALVAHAVALALGLPLYLVATSGGFTSIGMPGELVARVTLGGGSFVVASVGGVWLHDRISAAHGQRCQLSRRT
jgi:hypothetical protein